MHHRTVALLVTLAAAAALLALPTAAGAVPAIEELQPERVVAGAAVVATGTVEPAAANERVLVEQLLDGTWTQVGVVAVTDSTGAWSVTFRPRTGGQVRATQLSGTGGTSEPAVVAVLPRLRSAALARGPVLPFLGTSATWQLAAGYPDGAARVELSLDRRRVGFVRARVRDGMVRVPLPSRGVGRFRAMLVLPARGGFDTARMGALTFTVRGQRVRSGSSATWNRALRAALRFRGFHTPGGSSFDSRMGDSVIAFHKAYGRPRTTTFEAGDWIRLTRSAVQARDRSRGLHIEVDKGRQLLMQVRDGKPTMIIHVSTGRTGNTPAGRHEVLWKGNWVPSLYDSMLYKSMAFRGAYAIHGYPSVPTTPASAGCVRVPMWIAATLYRRSPVGTPVVIYEGPGGTRPSLGRGRTAVLPELTGIDPARWADER